MFRFRLGKHTTGADLVTATPTSGTYSNLLEAGKFYRVNFTKSNTELIYTYVGDTPVNGFKGVSGALTFDRLNLSGTDLKIVSILGTTFTGVECYELAWNDPLVNEPIGWDELKINLERDRELNGLVTQYTTNLTFWGDGYAYLLNALDTDGYCTQVPILIEERCSELDNWVTFFEGNLNLAETDWNLSECKAKTVIKDRGAVQTISKGKNVKVPYNEGASIYLAGSFTIDEFESYLIDAHNPSGVHGTYTDFPSNTVFGNFKYIITQISEGNIAFASDYFSTGDFEYLMLTPTIFLDQSITEPGDLLISFDEILRELDKMHNLSFAIEYNGSIPTLRVEPKTYFEDAASVLTIENVPDIKYKIDQDNLYRTVTVGNKAVIREGYLDKENKGEPYFSEFGCAGKDLNLLSEWIVDSNIIHEVLIHSVPGSTTGIDGQEFFGDFFLLECEPHPTLSGVVRTKIAPGNGFNELHTPEQYMERRITSLNADKYISSNKRSSIVSKLNTPLFREFEFSYPLTKAQFDLITLPGQTITFSGAGLTTPSNGYILEAEYMKRTGLTKFKLLGS